MNKSLIFRAALSIFLIVLSGRSLYISLNGYHRSEVFLHTLIALISFNIYLKSTFLSKSAVPNPGRWVPFLIPASIVVFTPLFFVFFGDSIDSTMKNELYVFFLGWAYFFCAAVYFWGDLPLGFLGRMIAKRRKCLSDGNSKE